MRPAHSLPQQGVPAASAPAAVLAAVEICSPAQPVDLFGLDYDASPYRYWDGNAEEGEARRALE